jgi:hypothetical protein
MASVKVGGRGEITARQILDQAHGVRGTSTRADLTPTPHAQEKERAGQRGSESESDGRAKHSRAIAEPESRPIPAPTKQLLAARNGTRRPCLKRPPALCSLSSHSPAAPLPRSPQPRKEDQKHCSACSGAHPWPWIAWALAPLLV